MSNIKRHIPQRTCIACRRVMPKRELNRVVRTVNGNVIFDPSGRTPGRGAYICSECLKDGFKTKQMEHTLKTTITKGDVEQMERFASEMTR